MAEFDLSDLIRAPKTVDMNPLIKPHEVSKWFASFIDIPSPLKVVIQRAFKSGQPFIHFKNAFSVVGLPYTPRAFAPLANRKWWPAAYSALGLMHLNDMKAYSYECENQGQVFVNLVAMPSEKVEEPKIVKKPDEGGKDSKTKPKSISAMRGHTDAAAHPLPTEDTSINKLSPSPNYVALMCLRNKKTATRVCALSDVYGDLSEEAIDELKLPQFIVTPQESFELSHPPLVNASILNDAPMSIRFSHRNVTVDPASDNFNDAQAALNELIEAIKSNMTDLVLEPGDIVFVNNQTAIHGRSQPEAQLGGKSRWLLRTYAILNSVNTYPVDNQIPHLLYP